jgi:acid phosphatase family membrane protein YuiD
MAEFLSTYILIAVPLLAWLLAQVTKTLFYLFSERQLNLAKLFDAGGMPSSHSAFVVALVTMMGFRVGVATSEVALAAALAAVVVYDATNLRRSAGDHAQMLNRIIPDLIKGRMVSDFDFKVLKEVLGHDWMEAAVGCIIGFFTAYAMTVNLS